MPDRDPGRWKLNPIIQERRRSVLLVLYLLDNYFVSPYRSLCSLKHRLLSCNRLSRVVDLPPSHLNPLMSNFLRRLRRILILMGPRKSMRVRNLINSTHIASELTIYLDLFWKYEFLRRCLAPTAERSCGDVRPMRYQEVFELDRKISEYKAEETASREPLQPENQLLDTLLPIKRVFLQLNCDTRK